MKIASILIVIFLFTSVLSYTEADSSISFLIRVRHKKEYIFQQTLDVFLDPKFFQFEKNRLPIKIDIPRNLINQSYLQVQYFVTGQTRPVKNSKRTWKITNQLPVSSSKLGSDVLFSLDDIITSKQLDIREVYPQTAYLKIVHDQKAFKILAPDYCIDQNIMLNAKQFTPLQQNSQNIISITLVPQLFQNNNFLQQIIYSLLKTDYQQYEQYFLKSYNKKLNKEEIKVALDFYDDAIKEIDVRRDQLRKRLASNPELKKKLEVLLVQRETLVNYKNQLWIITSKQKESDMLNQAKNILFVQSYEFLEYIKKYVFFNTNGLYTLVFIGFTIKIIAFQIIKIMLLMQIKNYFSGYKDHQGISLIPCYLIITYAIIHIVGETQSRFFSIFLLFYFMEPILSMKFQTIAVFPYYKIEVNRNYKKHEKMDYFLLFIICLIMLGLMLGYSLFSQKTQTILDEDTITPLHVDSLTIIASLLNKYFLFLIGMSQVLVNRRLKSVRHLTSKYVVMYSLLALLDNYVLLLNSQPFNFLFIVKQDLIAVILIYQCLKYADLGQGSRAYYRQLHLAQQLEIRRLQISQEMEKQHD